MVGILKVYLVFFAMLNNLASGVISVVGHLPKMEFLQLLYEFSSLFHLGEFVASWLEWQRRVGSLLVFEQKTTYSINLAGNQSIYFTPFVLGFHTRNTLSVFIYVLGVKYID